MPGSGAMGLVRGNCLAAVLLLVSHRAMAQPATATSPIGIRLDYQRAPGADTCPDEAAFRATVAAQTRDGADPFAANAARVLRVTLAPASPASRAGSFRGTLEMFDAAGRPAGAETKQAPTCAAVARALALSASVVFLSAPAPVSPSPAVPVAPAVRGTSTAPAPTAPTAPATSPPAVRVLVGAGALVGLGFAPNPSAGFGGFVGLRFPRAVPAFGLYLEGRGDVDSGGDVVSLASGAARPSAGFAGGTIAPCGHVQWFFGCGLVTLGVVRGSAGEAYEPDQQTSFFAGLGGRAGADLWIVEGPPAFGVRLAVDGLVALSRPAIFAAGELVWQAPIGAGAAAAHLVARF